MAFDITSVILSAIGADKQFGEAKQSLSECCKSGVLVINPVISAEVSTYLENLGETDELLPDSLFRQDSLPDQQKIDKDNRSSPEGIHNIAGGFNHR